VIWLDLGPLLVECRRLRPGHPVHYRSRPISQRRGRTGHRCL